jgi:hypothetical protein
MEILQTNGKMMTQWFYPEVRWFANHLVLVETSSKVAAGPLASGDPQVTLSHVVWQNRLL